MRRYAEATETLPFLPLAEAPCHCHVAVTLSSSDPVTCTGFTMTLMHCWVPGISVAGRRAVSAQPRLRTVSPGDKAWGADRKLLGTNIRAPGARRSPRATLRGVLPKTPSTTLTCMAQHDESRHLLAILQFSKCTVDVGVFGIDSGGRVL